MFERFTEKAINVVSTSQKLAKESGAAKVAPEHLLLALFDESKGISLKIFKSYDITHEKLEEEIKKYIPIHTTANIKQANLPFDNEYKEILKKTLTDGTPQQKMYAVAMPRQYSMLMNASCVILPFFKSNSGVLKPSCVSSLNPISSIWCVIENIFLAATAEGLACSMRIPVGEEGENVRKAVNAPENYLLPCYIGLGYPADDRPEVEQVKYNLEEKIHFGKW